MCNIENVAAVTLILHSSPIQPKLDMKTPFFKKILTLTSFVILISGFVAYKGGLLPNFFQKSDTVAPFQLSPNGSQLQSNTLNAPPILPNDSILPIVDSNFVRPAIISSKSMILSEPLDLNEVFADSSFTIQDSVKIDSLEEVKEFQRMEMMMYSSKSGRIFEPDFDSPEQKERWHKWQEARQRQWQDLELQQHKKQKKKRKLKQKKAKQPPIFPGSKAPVIIDRK